MPQIKLTVGDELPTGDGRRWRIAQTLRGGGALVDKIDARGRVVGREKMGYRSLQNAMANKLDQDRERALDLSPASVEVQRLKLEMAAAQRGALLEARAMIRQKHMEIDGMFQAMLRKLDEQAGNMKRPKAGDGLAEAPTRGHNPDAELWPLAAPTSR